MASSNSRICNGIEVVSAANRLDFKVWIPNEEFRLLSGALLKRKHTLNSFESNLEKQKQIDPLDHWREMISKN